MVFSNEKRPLKRSRLGPPDVYPQDPKQKEDELTVSNVKHGFAPVPQLSDEFGTARNCNITPSKVGSYFSAILSKKEELNTLPDSGRKRQQINTKDNFWPATARTKNAIENWFKDLAGNKPLINLSKKAPNFNKKEEIFVLLCEHNVPLMRAAWFVKLSSAYTVAVSEAKMKKRQLPDPTQEWTSTLIKFLKDQLIKLQEYYLHSWGTNITATEDQKLALKQWQYCTQLAKYLYEENLLERSDFLNWILELLDKLKSSNPEDGMLRIFLPLCLQYLDEFVQSEYISRKLAFLCCKKLGLLMGRVGSVVKEEGTHCLPNSNVNNSVCNGTVSNDPAGSNNNSNIALNNVAGNSNPSGNSSTNSNNSNNATNNQDKSMQVQVSSQFNDLLQCPHHRDVVMSLASILQVITLECPTALVWNRVGGNRSNDPLNHSALDNLTCPPSALPMPVRESNAILRQQIKQAETIIRIRSNAAETDWSCDKWQQSSDGQTTAKVLTALDALDRHSFNKTDPNNNLDTLYSKIFTTPVAKDGPQGEIRIESIIAEDEPIVEILCEWAVSCVRYGEHRAMAVAMLLEKRQAHLTGDNGENDDKDSVSSGNVIQNSLPIFQGLLMKFLDNDAPVLEENGTPQNKTMFTNLVHLFSELIRHDVFSHDAYMCTLISRGDLLTTSQGPGASYGSKPDTPGDGRGPQNTNDDEASLFPGIDLKPPKMEGHDYDDSKIDDDLDKLLQHIKEEQQNSMDAPDSPKDVGISHGVFGTQPSRHLLYTTHFPLPQDESSSHDCNQRHVLLYGVGKVRDEARHTVKKMRQDICKLFNKKFSIDVADGGKRKKYSRNEFNFELVTNKFQSLSYFDQHVVTWQCSLIVLEMLTSFASGTSNYLPVHEHVAFLFDLMELSYNIYGLIHVCIQILKELPEVENQATLKGYSVDHSYATGLALYIVAVLRRYHSCLLLSREQTVIVFQGLCNVVKHVTNPADCSSAERCILVHLYDLYLSCSILKCKPHCVEAFQNAYPKIKQALVSGIQPSPSNHVYNTSFMADLFQNPKGNGKIEPQWGRQLTESASNRYSLVCNAIIAVANETDNDRLNDIALTCAELTACCNSLSAEWLGVLQALFSLSSESCYYLDVLQQVDVQDFSIHNNLAVFVSILIARHCFSFEDFVKIAIPPLVRRGKDAEDEAGARLTCHLLLRLLKTVECPQPALYSGGTSPHPLEVFCMKLSCDRHLLTATHNQIMVGGVLAVLKAILVTADTTSKHSKPTKKEPSSKIATPLGGGELSISHILGTTDILGGGHDLLGLGSGTNNLNETTTSLSDFAQHVLKQICSQEWVLERCLQEDLCQPDMLLDNELTAKQAQRLLHMICYPNSTLDSNLDHRTIITRILETLDLWTLRISCLDLQLMYKQYSGTNDLNNWLDIVAKAAIDVFQLNSNDSSLVKDEKSAIAKKSKNGNIWLVAPLISKLPSAIQGRVLRVAGQVLESGNWSGKSRERDRSAQRSSSLLSHQPFLSLVLTCLKGQDDQREGLLTSLHNQLSQYIQLSKDERLSNYEDGKGRALMQDSLQLRFSLVGGMFDTVQRNSSTTTEWAILLLQLITYGVIDMNNNPELFHTVLDMLATLVHSTLNSDSQSDRSDETRKHYTNLMKKLKKEIGDRISPSILQVRQLLQLSKKQLEVVTVQPIGCLTDTKGNKITGFDSIDKKQGLQISEKQKVPPWEILEGHKNPAPLSWSWFGAIRVERRPLWYQDAHRLLKFHTHNLTKPASYYLDPPPLPPEDLEPVPEKPCSCVYCNQMKDDKADTPSSDTSPRGKKGVKKGLKRRNKNEPITPQPAMQPAMQPQMQMQQPMAYPNQNPMFAGQQGQQMAQQQGMGQQWGYGQPPNQQQMMAQQNMQNAQQQGYYPQQVPGQRFERPINQQSKQAITNMLRMRHPAQQFMGQQPFPQAPQAPMQQRPQFIRRSLEGVQQLRSQPVGMQGGAMFPQGNMYPNMQQGMNQNYGGYGSQQMNSQPMMNQQGGMSGMNFPQHQGFQQGGAGGGGGQGMMPGGPMQRAPDYMQSGNPCINQQRGIVPQRPYLQQAPNVTMNAMGGAMPGPGPGPAPPYPRPPNPGPQMNPQQSQQYQQRMRQQLLAMQQQAAQGNNPNNQQLGNPNQQTTPALMAQLQRQTQMPVQNPYTHQPPPY